jgi:hypothetical protein
MLHRPGSHAQSSSYFLYGSKNSDDAYFLSPLGIVFAFSSTKPEAIAKQWKEWNSTRGAQHRADMICLLEQETLIIDTNRFDRLFDDHQISTFEPIASCGKYKLVGIRSPAILFFFVNLLLRDLRKMVVQSQRLSGTTPSSYLRNVSLSRLFAIENAIDPHIADIIQEMTNL